MTHGFWHDAIIDKSFYALQNFRKNFDFVLIGGWAVYFYTKSLKSKDIDVIVDLDVLGKLKSEFNVYKNERLKKYEIKMGEFDIDIYVPFWSELGIPAEHVLKSSISLEGFRVPSKEVLLGLKIFCFRERKGTPKGKKDSLDIIGLLRSGIDFNEFSGLLVKYRLEYFRGELTELLNSFMEVKELGLKNKPYADLKKKILKSLPG